MFGWFKKYDAHLCSAVSGRILDNGKPLVGAKIERLLIDFDSKKRKDSTLTDEEGCFTLPAVNIRSRSPSSLFRQLLTSQDIYIKRNGAFYPLWSTSLWGVEPIAAYDKKLAQLNADLSNDIVAFTFINKDSPNAPHAAYSICRWDHDCEIQYIVED